MKALLLAAGTGSRLRPITETLPKCLVPIAGRPLLEFWLELLGPHESCSEIIINTHYMPEKVRECVAQNPYRKKISLAHETALLGTGGTLIQNLPRLKGTDTLVAHADNLTLFDLTEFQRAFTLRPTNCVATMMSFKTDSPQTCGILEIDGHGVVHRFHEKIADPPGDLANGAVFLFGNEALGIIGAIDSSPPLDISRDIMPMLLGRINTWKNDIYHRDIGNPTALAAAQTDFPDIYLRFRGNL